MNLFLARRVIQVTTLQSTTHLGRFDSNPGALFREAFLPQFSYPNSACTTVEEKNLGKARFLSREREVFLDVSDPPPLLLPQAGQADS